MDYEKKYKEALETARKCLDEKRDTCFVRLDVIFPELAESEDERIRKNLIQYLYALGAADNKEFIDWLEKQGERKPINNTEPKFHEGEWCINNEDGVIFQIVKVLDNTYKYRTNEGKEYSCTHYSLENDARLWTIADAKDGDVLLFEGYYNSIVLFQGIGINGKGRINYHCKCDLGNYSFGIQGDVACLGNIEKDAEHYHPATKEQRELLFQKMKEAGYKWDVEKKELRKMEQKPKWTEEEIRETQLDYWRSVGGKEWHGVPVQETIAWLEKQAPKPKWTVEDKEIVSKLQSALDYVDFDYDTRKKLDNWLKQIKQRLGGEE